MDLLSESVTKLCKISDESEQKKPTDAIEPAKIMIIKNKAQGNPATAKGILLEKLDMIAKRKELQAIRMRAVKDGPSTSKEALLCDEEHCALARSPNLRKRSASADAEKGMNRAKHFAVMYTESNASKKAKKMKKGLPGVSKKGKKVIKIISLQ